MTWALPFLSFILVVVAVLEKSSEKQTSSAYRIGRIRVTRFGLVALAVSCLITFVSVYQNVTVKQRSAEAGAELDAYRTQSFANDSDLREQISALQSLISETVEGPAGSIHFVDIDDTRLSTIKIAYSTCTFEIYMLNDRQSTLKQGLGLFTSEETPTSRDLTGEPLLEITFRELPEDVTQCRLSYQLS